MPVMKLDSFDPAFRRSASLTMLYRSKIERVLCPVMVMATRSGIPTRTRFRTVVRRRSCGEYSEPAASRRIVRGEAGREVSQWGVGEAPGVADDSANFKKEEIPKTSPGPANLGRRTQAADGLI